MNRFVLVLAFAFAFGLVACQGRSHEATSTAAASSSTSVGQSSGERHEILVDASGYHPASLEVRAGVPVTLVFKRTSDEGCGQQLSFPSLGIRKDLPLDTPVEVSFTPERGEIAFTCGMDMLRGSVVVR